MNRGISAQDDTAYYQFLLKLGVIRAQTWGERWDLWRATHGAQAVPRMIPAATRSARSGSSTGSGPIRAAMVKAKLPFLASASSDLDEGFAPTLVSAYSADADGESDGDGDGDDENGSRHSRSLVGYTPSASEQSFLPPARTSTPTIHQPRARRYITPTPPPYSETESIVIDDGLATPRARPRGLIDVDASDMEEQLILEQETLREMERRADDFYRTGLIGRCWDRWIQTNDWVQVGQLP